MENNERKKIDLIHLKFNPTSKTLALTYISSNGSDDTNCGWEDIPCSSFHSVISNSNNKIIILENKSDSYKAETSPSSIT